MAESTPRCTGSTGTSNVSKSSGSRGAAMPMPARPPSLPQNSRGGPVVFGFSRGERGRSSAPDSRLLPKRAMASITQLALDKAVAHLRTSPDAFGFLFTCRFSPIAASLCTRHSRSVGSVWLERGGHATRTHTSTRTHPFLTDDTPPQRRRWFRVRGWLRPSALGRRQHCERSLGFRRGRTFWHASRRN